MIRPLSDIKKIIIHCSASDFGDKNIIDTWHKARGWNGCGYHFVITNGIPEPGKPYRNQLDGIVQTGRSLNTVGAHCRGHNEDSIGICLIGQHLFTPEQLLYALPNLLASLLKKLNLKPENIHGHCEFSAKTCPNFDPGLLRKIIGRD